MREAIRVFEEWLRDIPSVEGVRARRPCQIEVRTIVNNASEEERYAIYGLELRLMERFPDMFFDFRLLDRRDAELSTVITLDEASP